MKSWDFLVLWLVVSRDVYKRQINDERTLVPENKSASQGKNMAARELIKRLKREFARELKKITFDRTGKIPERRCV